VSAEAPVFARRSITDRTLGAIAERIGLAAASRIRIGRLTVEQPDGRRQTFGDPSSERHAEIRIHDPEAAVRILLHGETGVGESYMDGQWSSPDLEALIELAALNRSALALNTGWWRLPVEIPRRLAHRARRNTKDQAQKNISAHYDLGNDFYRLFLDDSMTYSSAVFERGDETLEEAQRTKYRRIADGAGLRPGMHVLEVGSGWGGFALYAAGERGCRVTSITISKEQHALARARVAAAGLEDLIEIRMQDYRDIDGQYDAVVSIEMLEAVGADYFDT
jgi:cyclopropane-fatty-acyl-phospholipid synthase